METKTVIGHEIPLGVSQTVYGCYEENVMCFNVPDYL